VAYFYSNPNSILLNSAKKN